MIFVLHDYDLGMELLVNRYTCEIRVNTWIWQNIIDESLEIAITGGNITLVIPLIIAFLLVMILINLRELFEQIIKIKLTHRLRDNLLPQISNKILNLEYKCFEDRKINDLIMRVGNSPEEQFTQFFWELLFVPSYIIAMFGYSLLIFNVGRWLLPLIVILAIPALFLTIKDSSESYALSKKQTINERKSEYLSSLITGRSEVKEIRIFNLNNYLSERWFKLKKEQVDEKLNLAIQQRKRFIFVETASLVLVFGSVVGFVLSVRTRNISFGQFVALCGAMESIVQMVTWNIPYQFSTIKHISMYGEEYFEFMNLP